MTKKYLPLLEVLTGASVLQRKAILRTLTKQQLRAILEAVYNVLRGTCPLHPKDKKTLFEYRDIIRRMVSKKLSEKQQRLLVNKYQNILPLLLKPAIRALKQ